MKYVTLLIGCAAVAALASCSSPCMSSTCASGNCSKVKGWELNNCRGCAGSGEHTSTCVHLNTSKEHVEVCPSIADHRIIYGTQPGT